MIRYSALLALAFAAVLGLVALLGNWGTWPFWAIELIAAGVLVWGGRRGLERGSSRLLSAAWGLTVGILWVSFFSLAEALNSAAEASAGTGIFSAGQLTLVMGALLVTAIGGLVMSLAR